MTGTIASPADLSCHLRRWRLQRNAGVARHPPEPDPESATTVRYVLHEAFALLMCRELATRRVMKPQRARMALVCASLLAPPVTYARSGRLSTSARRFVA